MMHSLQTRAQKLLQMSLQKQKKTAKTDIVAMAKDWGCKVVYLDELLTEISKLKPLPPKDDQVRIVIPISRYNHLHLKWNSLQMSKF